MDFEDLLEDVEPTGKHTLASKKNWKDIAASKLKDRDDLDDLLDDDLWPVTKKTKANPVSAAKTTKYTIPQEDDDEWGVPTQPAKT